MNKTLLLALGLGAGFSVAQAQLFTTGFDSPVYSDGNLVGQDGWANHSGSGSFIQVSNTASDGFITLENGSGSREDANIDLGDTMEAGDIWSASFDITVSDFSGDAYFAHFKDDGTGFNGRIFLVDAVDGGDFNFGISEGSSSEANFASDFTFGTTYRPTVTYNFDTGLSTLTIGSDSISSVNADIGEDISQFAFRQAGGTLNATIDNLTVVPEPSAAGILALTAAGFLGLRRRRS